MTAGKFQVGLLTVAEFLACLLFAGYTLGVPVSAGAQATKTAGRQAVFPPSTLHPGPAWFEDVAPKAGLRVLNVNGDTATKKYIIEATGSGVAIFDYDNDGWPDIFLVNGKLLHEASPPHGAARKENPTSHLFHNNHDGTFTDVTAKAGITGSGWGQGACVGDYDNDGFDDLYVTTYGHNLLYHNQGNGTFKEVAAQSGAAGNGQEWGTGCAFVDYDRDGLLDIAIANYVHFDLAKTPEPGDGPGCMFNGTPVMCGPRGLASAPNTLLHNLGHGKFEDVSKKSGFEATHGHYCFSVSTLDYDEDGWPDIYVACDGTPAVLYRNNHDGTFTDRAPDVGVAFNEDGREQAGMGSTVADYDGDGHLDIFKTNFSEDTSTLYHNNGDGSFTDVTFAAGLGINTDLLGWGAMFIDLDNHGLPDLFVVNGHVYPEVDANQLNSSYREPRALYRNLGNGKFKDISKVSGPGILQPTPGRGLAIGDLWNDGRQEAVINNISDYPMLLVNLAANKNHWLCLHLVGKQSNRDGIGARVTVQGQSRSWADEVRSGSSYNSSNDLRIHFGLGSETTIKGIHVRWPNGNAEQFPGVAVDQCVTLTEGSGAAPTSAAPK